MALPLPNIVPNVGVGGRIFDVMNAIGQNANALTKGQLENQYYAPSQEANIGYKNALTQGQNISNQYMPQQMQLANAFQQLQNQYYVPNQNASIANTNALTNKLNTMTPLEAEKLRISNQFAPQLNQSNMDAQRALANSRAFGVGRMGVDQQALQGLKQQIMMDNPGVTPEQANEMADAALGGEEKLSNGEPYKLSNVAKSMITNINKKHSTAAIQNQAANMDVLASDLNGIDIKPVARFAGLPGKLDIGKYMADMAMGKPVPEEFRDYLAFKRISSNFSMDALRKGFGTSVVPGYVYSTLGKAADPTSSFWNDPKQVMKEWDTTKKWVNDNAKKYKLKADKGATANLDKDVIKFVRNASGQLVREGQ